MNEYTTADYLNQLEQDRQDLVDNLETQGISGLSGDETFTELVPEVLNISGGGSTPTTLAEFSQQVTDITNSFLNYLDTTYIQNRTAYTNQSVNLYTPDIDCKFYVIRKRNDVYSVIWNNSVAMYRDYSNFMTSTPILYSTQSGAVQSQLALASNPRLQFRQASANQKGYYSNETFSTKEEAVTAMLNNQITYTQNSGNNYYIQADTPYMCPYSNMVLVDTSTGENILKDTMVISHNETIVAMS